MAGQGSSIVRLSLGMRRPTPPRRTPDRSSRSCHHSPIRTQLIQPNPTIPTTPNTDRQQPNHAARSPTPWRQRGAAGPRGPLPRDRPRRRAGGSFPAPRLRVVARGAGAAPAPAAAAAAIVAMDAPGRVSGRPAAAVGVGTVRLYAPTTYVVALGLGLEPRSVYACLLAVRSFDPLVDPKTRM